MVGGLVGSKGGSLCDAKSASLFSCPLTSCILCLSLLLLAGQLSLSGGSQLQMPCRRPPRAGTSSVLLCFQGWCKKTYIVGADGWFRFPPPFTWELLHFWLLSVQPGASAARGMGSLSSRLHLFSGGGDVCGGSVPAFPLQLEMPRLPPSAAPIPPVSPAWLLLFPVGCPSAWPLEARRL